MSVASNTSPRVVEALDSGDAVELAAAALEQVLEEDEMEGKRMMVAMGQLNATLAVALAIREQTETLQAVIERIADRA